MLLYISDLPQAKMRAHGGVIRGQTRQRATSDEQRRRESKPRVGVSHCFDLGFPSDGASEDCSVERRKR